MKAVVRVVALFLFVVLLPADLAFSEAQKPIRDPEGCLNCTLNHITRAAQCGDAAEWGDPSNWLCTGGVFCWNTADGHRVCQPDCGSRCYSI